MGKLKAVPLHEADPAIDTPPLTGGRRWVRRVLCAFALVAVGYSSYKAVVFYADWQEAAQCLALTASVEGNVLDRRGEMLIDDAVGNRALQIRGSASFLQKLCQAAFAKHWNKPLQKRFPNFSGLAQWWYTTPGERSGWERSLSVAQEELWKWEVGVWWRLDPFHDPNGPHLPKEYLYYHNSPAPEGFKKSNGGLVCNLRHTYGKYGLDFCSLGPPPIIEF